MRKVRITVNDEIGPMSEVAGLRIMGAAFATMGVVLVTATKGIPFADAKILYFCIAFCAYSVYSCIKTEIEARKFLSKCIKREAFKIAAMEAMENDDVNRDNNAA